MPKILLQLILLLTLSYTGYGQVYSPAYAVRLKHELSISHEDSVRVRLLYHLGEYYSITTEPSKNKDQFLPALHYFEQALVLSERLKLQNQYHPNNIRCKLGDVAYLQYSDAEGYTYYKKVIDFYVKRHEPEKAGDTYAKLAYTNALIGKSRESLRYWENAKRLYARSNNMEKKLDAEVKSAMTYFVTDQDDSVKVLCTQLINANKNSNYKAVGLAYRGLAMYYRYKADFNKALFYIFESEKWALKTGDAEHLHSIYGEFAQIYQGLGQADKSITYYKKTLELRTRQLIRQDYIFRTAGFLIQQLIKKNKQAEGLELITKLEHDYYPVGEAASVNIAQAKAYCYDALRQYGLAEKYYKVVVDYYSSNNTELYKIALFDISKFFVARKEYNKAAGYLSKTGDDTTSVERLKDIRLLLYKVDSAHHNYHAALRHLLGFQSLNNSIFNATKNKQIEELNIKYETDQRLQNISVLQKESELQRERVKHSDKIRNMVLGSVIILLFFMMVLYRNYRRNEQNNSEISKKNLALNQLITEKEWLLKEVHHRVKNNLQIVMGLLQRQSAYIRNDEALAALRNSEQRMHAIALIHQKLYQSDSYMLVSMTNYINELVGYLQECFDLDNRVVFEKQIADIDLDVNVAVPLGLILNEAITNAIKHACYSHPHCCIQLKLDQTGEHQYFLEIADNGAGLPPDFDLDQISSMGFSLMRGLSKQLGGKLICLNNNGLVIRTEFYIR